MKELGWIFTLLLLAAVQATAAAGSAKEEITALEKRMIACTSADELMKYYDDKDVTVYDVTPPLQFKGAKAVHDDFDEFFKAAGSDLKGEFLDLAVVADGNMGMARSLQHFTWKDKDGKPVSVTIRVTDVFHRAKNDWKVIHSHISVPVDLKTNQGQIDLKP
jgi:ketosteroid isomerase-like protein